MKGNKKNKEKGNNRVPQPKHGLKHDRLTVSNMKYYIISSANIFEKSSKYLIFLKFIFLFELLILLNELYIILGIFINLPYNKIWISFIVIGVTIVGLFIVAFSILNYIFSHSLKDLFAKHELAHINVISQLLFILPIINFVIFYAIYIVFK